MSMRKWIPVEPRLIMDAPRVYYSIGHLQPRIVSCSYASAALLEGTLFRTKHEHMTVLQVVYTTPYTITNRSIACVVEVTPIQNTNYVINPMNYIR